MQHALEDDIGFPMPACGHYYNPRIDVDVEIRQAQAKPLSLLLTYNLLIHVTKLQD